jgi:glutamyl-Q tRNA(Asp) synthetase
LKYIGRFAPSPTGPLHFGSLVAAVASYCDAKANNGKWLLRIEDLDKPREVSGATQTILLQLACFGFIWDDEIIYQSERTFIYQAALNALSKQKLTYPCTCSRKEIADAATHKGIEGAIYPGTCLHERIKLHAPIAWRIKAPDSVIAFEDRIQGKQSQNIAQDIGDYVLKRVDQLFAYQLAVVVDDADQHITHVVRGVDLLNSTARQIYLQQSLQLTSVQYAHIPVVTNAQGEKLSKQTLAPAINSHNAAEELCYALQFLNQNPPEYLKRESLTTIWDWAIDHWSIAKIQPNINNCI